MRGVRFLSKATGVALDSALDSIISFGGHDQRRAGEQYRALVPIQGLTHIYRCTDRILGLLSHTIGDLDQGRENSEGGRNG